MGCLNSQQCIRQIYHSRLDLYLKSEFSLLKPSTFPTWTWSPTNDHAQPVVSFVKLGTPSCRGRMKWSLEESETKINKINDTVKKFYTHTHSHTHTHLNLPPCVQVKNGKSSQVVFILLLFKKNIIILYSEYWNIQGSVVWFWWSKSHKRWIWTVFLLTFRLVPEESLRLSKWVRRW